MKKLVSLVAVLLAVGFWTTAGAQSEQPVESEMPPMGPPAEMLEIVKLTGVWDVAMKSKWDPADTVWTETVGVCEFSLVADGAAMMMDFKSDMMGMPFYGVSLQCFDRETGQWQSVWTDNMGARLSMYVGNMKDGKMVMTGEELWQGQKSIGRMTTFNLTDTTFEWTMEQSSDGGKTFVILATAIYTKQP